MAIQRLFPWEEFNVFTGIDVLGNGEWQKD